MAYALINKKGEVMEIREKSFVTENPTLEVVILNSVAEGDELNFFIIVTKLEDSEDGEPYRIATAYSGIRQTAALQRLRLDNEKLQQENAALILQVAGLERSNLQLTQDQAALLLQLAEKGVL
ncbi:hypothetical protein [Paenibacillus apiarius]|uniref:hypothetical protein n=1 Tax=Paenibacillus apiarius TaxID=46240 RepID=UPI003B3A38C8